MLHTRELRGGLVQRLMGFAQVEVTASTAVNVPSRFGESDFASAGTTVDFAIDADSGASRMPPAHEHDYRAKFRDDLKGQLSDLQSMIEDLCRKSDQSSHARLTRIAVHLFTDLIDAEISEELARELMDRVRKVRVLHDLDDPCC